MALVVYNVTCDYQLLATTTRANGKWRLLNSNTRNGVNQKVAYNFEFAIAESQDVLISDNRDQGDIVADEKIAVKFTFLSTPMQTLSFL